LHSAQDDVVGLNSLLSVIKMDSLFASPSNDIRNQQSQLRQDIARSSQDLKHLNKNIVYEKSTAMMLYDASGFRIEFPLKYISDLLKRRSVSPSLSLTTEHREALFYTWWDRTLMNQKHLLANELVFGFTKRSKMAKTFVDYQKLSEWVRSANLTRGLAPTMVKNLEVTDADTLNTTGRADMKLEKYRSFFKRFVHKLQLKRVGIRARFNLTQDGIRTAALPNFMALVYLGINLRSAPPINAGCWKDTP